MAKSTSQNNLSLALPITQEARRTARAFTSSLPPLKAEQVFLNTLAVWVVNDYLQMLGLNTNLEAGDSWNQAVRLCSNVADLEIEGVGRLECRPVRAESSICYVPREVWEDRIGYVFVQFDRSLREATLLGFIQTVAMYELPLSKLQALEELLERLHQFDRTGKELDELPLQTATQSPNLVNLSQWLKHAFESGWQPIEALLAPAQTSLAFRYRGEQNSRKTDSNHLEGSVRRAKLIDLGIQLAGHPVALFVEVEPESIQKTNLLLQVHPVGSQTYLPPQLQLIVLDETGAVFLEARARHADNYIQLQFGGHPGERFSVTVALGEVSITEAFVI